MSSADRFSSPSKLFLKSEFVNKNLLPSHFSFDEQVESKLGISHISSVYWNGWKLSIAPSRPNGVMTSYLSQHLSRYHFVSWYQLTDTHSGMYFNSFSSPVAPKPFSWLKVLIGNQNWLRGDVENSVTVSLIVAAANSCRSCGWWEVVWVECHSEWSGKQASIQGLTPDRTTKLGMYSITSINSERSVVKPAQVSMAPSGPDHRVMKGVDETTNLKVTVVLT